MAEQNRLAGLKSVPRGLQFALFLTAMAWIAAANGVAPRAAHGLAVRFGLGTGLGSAETLMQSVFLLFLVVVGFRLLDWIATRGQGQAEVLALPRRAGWGGEWGVGAAIGWGLALAVALPVLLTGNLHARLKWEAGSGVAIAISLATLLVAALAEEVIFRGYAFRRLMDAIGPSAASVLLSFGFGLVLIANPPKHFLMALVDGMMFGLLLSMAYLRTHGLWLGWGLHFTYRAVTAVVLGLPVAGHGEFGAVTDTYVSGARWLSGGAFGLDAALLTGFILLGGMAVLYRSTREYAWKYTHREIVAGGYEVVVAPPAAHLAMGKEAAAPVLVQILPTTPGSRSVQE